MDFEIPDDINYLPKPRMGFVPITGPKKLKSSNSGSSALRPKPPSRTTTTKTAKNPTTTTRRTTTTGKTTTSGRTSAVKTTSTSDSKSKEATTKTVKRSTASNSTATTFVKATNLGNNQTTKKIEKITAKGGETQRVVAVYPTKGKVLSKVPDAKFKPVKDGPREDPNIVRTEAEEIAEFLRLTNEFRQKNNLPTLKLYDELSQIAKPHNENMMKGKTGVGHEGFSERAQQIKKKKAASENCAMYVGPREHLTTLMENLINSPPHRKNLLGDFNAIGIAIGKNSENMWYVTQLFARF